MPRLTSLIAPLATVAALALPAAASASQPALPLTLPGDASAASVSADPAHWIVGARPGAAASAIARRYGASAVAAGQGGYVVARIRARALAGALRARGLLVYAQPDAYAHTFEVTDDPLSGPPDSWRAVVADPKLDPPVVTPTSPLIALVDARLDETHPEWTGDPNVSTLGGEPLTNLHGTATAAVASAPKNGIGILGVWPGARTLNVP
ncbi:MAG: hypothetical protein QOE28_1442, partial [Solirubrobacteraceae bacterium]|nr:hypothetical protein [Solirubrobacteraceae bacterium]